jgi:hypothetical protein
VSEPPVVHPDAGHPGLDQLAEFDLGVAGPETTTVAEHVGGCPQCRAALATLRATQALLSALPQDAMPADIAARLEARIADVSGLAADEPETGDSEPAAAPTIVPLEGRRRGRAWNTPAIAGVAAGVAVLMLAGAIVAGVVLHGRHSGTTASNADGGTAAAGASAGAGIKEWSTGSDYTATNLAQLVPRLVTASPPPQPVGGVRAPQATSPSRLSSSSASTAESAPAAPGGGAGQELTLAGLQASRAAVVECGHILAGDPTVVPEAVDFARFNGRPAAVFALPSPGHPASIDVWVVRSTCSPASADFYFRRIPRGP